MGDGRAAFPRDRPNLQEDTSMEFHIRCDAADIARYVFVPGDHGRAKRIADHLDAARLVSDSRGYMVYTGSVDGVPMTVASTGMGGPQVAIGIEELAHMGADTFIRVGSCGTLQDRVRVGDIIIPTGIVRGGATANNYLPPAFPAAPNFTMLTALIEAAQNVGAPFHVGVGWSTDAFYAESDPGYVAKLKEAGVLSVEMEADTLFVVSNFRGWRAGALFANDGTSTEIKPVWGEDAFRRGEAQSIEIAIAAMKVIADLDAAGAKAEGGA
jgi:uridine phosphorylase